MKKSDKELIIEDLIKSKEIRDLYDDYIIKTIPFETWVRNTADRLIGGSEGEPITILPGDERIKK